MKRVLILIILFANVHICSAQLYIGLGTDFTTKLNGRTVLEYDLYDYSATANSYTLTESKSSFGNGMFFNATIGYQFNNKVAFELNGGYHRSGTMKVRDSYPTGGVDYEMKATNISLRPSLLLFITEGQKALYTRIGVVYSSGELNWSSNQNVNGNRSESELELTGATGFGYTVGIGMQWKLGTNTKLTTELNAVNLNMSPKEGRFTKYTVQGVNYMDSLTVSQKEFSYNKDATTLSNNPPTNSPSNELKTQLPFNGVGLKLGFIYTLGNRKKS